VLALAGCGGADGPAAEPFTNPVYDADFPDPFVLEVDGTYYAYATNGNGKQVQTLTSPDLVHWKPGPDALPQVGGWTSNGNLWAPEVLARDDGTYVLYYTANRCIGRAVADHPLGPFADDSDAALVCEQAEGGSIDASPFRDDDGSLYLYWKNDANSIGQTTWIYVAPLSDDGLELEGEPVRLVSNDAGWEGGVVEAPLMWKEDGRYYLFYSGNGYEGDLYAVGYATCERPLGPCEDAPENPILKSACAASGPGHNALIRKGDETWTLYHAWPAETNDDKRVLWLDRVAWEDGAPRIEGPTCTEQPAP
jgi:beta-xylosidase